MRLRRIVFEVGDAPSLPLTDRLALAALLSLSALIGGAAGVLLMLMRGAIS